MAEEKESTSIPLSQADTASGDDPEDPAKSPPSSPNSSTRRVIPFSLLFIFITLQNRAKSLDLVSFSDIYLFYLFFWDVDKSTKSPVAGNRKIY